MNKPIPAGLSSLMDFEPTKPKELDHALEVAALAIGEAHGFVDRHPVKRRRRNKPTDEPTHNFTARITVRAANRFIEYCEQERISYREGFDRLIALLDRP